MSNESSLGSASPDSQSHSGVGQTANIGRATSVSSGAAKVFREFKWGLLTLFLLMVVVIGLVYDGGRKKKVVDGDKSAKPDDSHLVSALDMGVEAGAPPIPSAPGAPMDLASAPGIRTAPVVETYSAPPPLPAAPEFRHEPRLAVTPVPAPGTTVTPPGQPTISAPVTPMPATTTPPSSSDKTYIVKSGDTLTSIASTVVPGKGSLKALLEANKDVLPNPNKLKVGMTLKIPTLGTPVEAPVQAKTEVAAGKKLDPVAAPAVEGATADYVVQSGDTLERIARRVFNDGRKWRDIYEWNRDQLPSASRLRVGQTLKMKPSASATTTLPPAATPRVEEDSTAPKKIEKSSVKAEIVDVKEENENDSPVFSSTSASIP